MTMKPWRTMLLWGLAIVAVYLAGAVIDMTAWSGTCMFVLLPFFGALVATMPVIRIGRFGAGVGAYVPYAVLGFFPLLWFDWLQSHALRGAWAAVVFSLSGPLIGLCADLAYRVSARLHERWRSAIVGTAVQAATFATMLAGLTLLYVDPTAADSHARLFDQRWYFTLPWMALNGDFGGYAAHAIRSRA